MPMIMPSKSSKDQVTSMEQAESPKQPKTHAVQISNKGSVQIFECGVVGL